MILAFPQICDALTTLMNNALGATRVFDGPQVRQVGPSGVAIGATREDVSSEFTSDSSSLGGDVNQGTTITCLAWAGGGGTVFKPYRDTVRDIVTAASDAIAADRTLGGVVSTADLTGGVWMQEQTGEGAVVTCEFRVYVRKF
jgi:hypothetical protein